ncbi:HD domain-containing protein [Gimesia aquarii]|uniref:HD/PDEase domain-containing protein n=1 Tax=Gimesia aquarii TaxID=2527964 RepID=A0A517WW31_9PLAN|nr:HD domain-containing protein [Gimesia aquarii]QDU09467.1 hypothetical protein V202x_28420 [Gimesia aquarii]
MNIGTPPKFKHFQDDSYRALLIALRMKVAGILANNLLHHFTDHSVNHSDNVASLVDQLQEGIKEPLSDQELIILYSSCYLHDIGMHYECAGKTKVISDLNLTTPWEEQTESERREYLRAYHNQISAEMVRNSMTSSEPPIGIQLTAEFNGSYIANLCHAHCIPTNTDKYKDLVEEGPSIRTPLLSAFLRIADILDESRRRASREKERTLLLDLESQTHWWRHYYTEDVTLDVNQRLITVWFDFPQDYKDEYSKVIPKLQMPWIRDELQHHETILLKNGCHWTATAKVRDKLHSDAMPEEVLTTMLKQLSRRRNVENEAQQLATLTLYKEAQPSIRRRIDSLQKRNSELETEEYLIELSNIATDLFELGRRRDAHSLLFNPYTKDLKQLTLDMRLKIGLRLLEWEIDDGDHFSIRRLLQILTPEFSDLPNSDKRKWLFTKSQIRALEASCEYLESKEAIEEALEWASASEKPWLKAELSQMELLQGDFSQDRELN